MITDLICFYPFYQIFFKKEEKLINPPSKYSKNQLIIPPKFLITQGKIKIFKDD